MKANRIQHLIAAGAAVWLGLAEGGAEEARGRVLDWIRGLGDPAVADQSARALNQLDQDSLGELIEILEWRENKLEWLLSRAGGRLGIATPVEVDTAFVVQTATYLIGQFGEEGHTAAPALARLLDHPSAEVRAKATRALQRIGRRAVPELSHLLDGPSETARLHALKAGGAIGPAAAGLIPKLIPLLFDPSLPVREEAYVTMARIGGEASPAIPVLLAAAGDDRPAIRARAIRTLAWVGRESEEAGEKLDRALGDASPLVRAEAAMGLGTSMVPAGVAIPKLAGLALEEDLEVRQAVITSALNYGEAALGPLEALVRDGRPEAARGALELLGEFGGAAAPLRASLAGMESKRPELSREIRAALAKLEGR